MSIATPILVPVRLEARDGSHVATVPMPRFVPLPDVVIWDERVFTSGGSVHHPEQGVRLIYREAITWHAAAEYES